MKRIEFIDLAKGVCIIWVVLYHIQILPVDIPGMNSARMPLYFILSGLFFKTYGNFHNFLIKKTNKILIPFLFFYLISYAVFHACNHFLPGLIKSNANNIFDLFTQREFFNGPIWFLLSLFWANLIFCRICLSIKSEIWRAVAVVAVTGVGITLGKLHVFLPLMIDNSMTALLFFYFGYLLKQTDLLFPNKYDRYNIPIALALYGLSLALYKVFDNPRIMFLGNAIVGNIPVAYILSVVSVLSILFLCKAIKKLPFVSYFGRYSIIPLCIHHLAYRPVLLIVARILPPPISTQYPYIQGVVVAVITLAICYAAIPICIKYLPYVTAQKDLLRESARQTISKA